MAECPTGCYLIGILSPFYIIAIVLNFLSIFRSPYNIEECANLKENWEKQPIISISFDQKYFNLNGKINKNNLKDLYKAFIAERLDKKYNYKYLLREDVNEPGFHPCGKDTERNYLFLPNEVECPINELIISFSSNPEIFKDENNYYHYKSAKFYDGIYLHYTNENINSTILIDIDFQLVETTYERYQHFRQIIEESYALNFAKKYYIGFILKPMIDGKRDLTDFKAFLNYDKKKYLNIASLILLFLSLISVILDILGEGYLPIFQIITTISLYIQIVIQVIIYIYYGEIEQLDEILKKYYYNHYSFYHKIVTKYLKYNTVVLSFVVIITGYYLPFTSHRKNDKNYYYYLVYCFRNINFYECNSFCKERVEKNKVRNNRIISELEDDIDELDDKISECDREKRYLIDENEEILKEIVNKSNILNNMKDEENSFWNMKEEEIKFEKHFQKLIKDNELNIKKFENLKNQIKNIEKEINYYKMIEFKQELNNK